MILSTGGYLTFYMPGKRTDLELDLTEPKALQSLLIDVGIPLEEVHMAVINDKIVDLDQAIVENHDRVKVYSPIDGG